MTSERWQRIKQVIGGALEQADLHSRSHFIREACNGDTALRREVESLLATRPERFEEAAEELRVSGLESNVGRRIGAYILVRELGHGGMGAVYLAERADQEFKKQVAIKLLKRGTDTDEVLRRFRGEREILARLEHPNIGRLFDGGTTDDGLPYFVMEFVVGTPITTFCADKMLPVEERLRLFLKVCDAVRFAHQNLIVHRDLKPANILVTADGEPKLLDFGIAKLLETDQPSAFVTIFEHQRLTPAYASPEQVRGDPITTVSDIYALGALLYEILSGQTAHRFATPNPPPTEMWRVVITKDPVAPSTAASDASLRRILRGDLDNIVLKALRKDPARRYGGIGAFAEDIRRYLDDRPVYARKDTLSYRAGKFFKRNKLGAAASVIVLLTLIGGIIGTSYQARVAQRERAKAERRFDEVHKVANSLMFELDNSIKDIPGAMAARQLVMRRAVEYLDQLAQESGNDLSLKSELALAYQKIGNVTFDVQEAIARRRKAVALNEEVFRAAPANVAYTKQLASSYNALSDVMKIASHSEESMNLARRALALSEKLAQERPNDIDAQTAAADQNIALSTAALDAGDFKTAIDAALRGLSIQQTVVDRLPNDRQELRDLGEMEGIVSDAYDYAGDHLAALDHGRRNFDMTRQIFEAAPEAARNRRDMWSAHFRMARLLADGSEPAAARDEFERALQIIENLATADPGDKGHQRWLAVTHSFFGEFLMAQNDLPEAGKHVQKAITISEPMLAADPDRVETRRDLARVYEVLGVLDAKRGQSSEAVQALLKSKSLLAVVIERDPWNSRARSRLAKIEADLGDVERKANPSSACEAYRRSMEFWQKIQNDNRLTAVDAKRLDEVKRRLADCSSVSK